MVRREVTKLNVEKVFILFLAIGESILAFTVVKPAVYDLIRFTNTRWQIIRPDFWYFLGMFVGDMLRLMIGALLVGHAVWLCRKVRQG